MALALAHSGLWFLLGDGSGSVMLLALLTKKEQFMRCKPESGGNMGGCLVNLCMCNYSGVALVWYSMGVLLWIYANIHLLWFVCTYACICYGMYVRFWLCYGICMYQSPSSSLHSML
jgi:hypothetical protein